MTKYKTDVNAKDNTYKLTMITDDKSHYSIVQYLIRNLISGLQCSVTTAEKLNPNTAYVYNSAIAEPFEQLTFEDF